MKALLDLFKQVTQDEEFDSIKIGLASPEKIRSWSFYSGGGIGQAVWSRDGDTWTLKTTAKSAKGQKVSATNLVTMVDNDHMTWQLTKLTVDGKSLPDPNPVKMKRVKPKE